MTAAALLPLAPSAPVRGELAVVLAGAVVDGFEEEEEEEEARGVFTAPAAVGVLTAAVGVLTAPDPAATTGAVAVGVLTAAFPRGVAALELPTPATELLVAVVLSVFTIAVVAAAGLPKAH